MTHNEIVDKLAVIRPGTHWALTGNTYEGFIWLDSPETKPTREEIGI